MIIGIDIDDTISRTNDKLIEEAIRYDKEHVKGKGFKNKNAYSFMEMFYWSVLDFDGFMKTVRNGRFFKELLPIDDAALYINKLREEGNKIYFITRRINSFRVKYSTKKWLKKYGFNYDKLIMYAKDKGSVCQKENVELFIDNDIKNVLSVKECGINVVLMADVYNKGEKGVKRLTTWEEIYKYAKGVK